MMEMYFKLKFPIHAINKLYSLHYGALSYNDFLI